MNARQTVAAPLAAAILAAATLIAAPALADAPGKDWMPIDQVLTKLSEAGYGPVRSVEADDGVWKAKAERDGRTIKVQVDPRTGAVVERAKRQSDD